MSVALQVVGFPQPLTAKELERRLQELCGLNTDWTTQVHEALLHGKCVRMLGTCPTRQASDPRSDHCLTPQEVAKSTLITPTRPRFRNLNRAGLYFDPDILYDKAFIWSFRRSILTPAPHRYAAEAFVRHLAHKLK
jgi:hypothetical protein